MNLWAKRAGLLLSAAVLIFLISCEDDSFLLGFKGKTKFKGVYHEIVFDSTRSSVILLDSVLTDQFQISANPTSAAYRYLLGEYIDPDFGTVRGEVFASYLPNDPVGAPTIFDAPADGLDSVTLQLLFDYYTYGPEMTLNEKVTVYELTDSLNFYRRYFNNSTVTHTGVPLGVLTLKKFSKGKYRAINLTPLQLEEQLDRSAGSRDTLMLQAKLNLDGSGDDDLISFAQRLYGYLNTEGDSALIGKYLKKFRKNFPGFAFIPTQSGKVIGVNPLHALSRLTVHYHTATADSLTVPLYFTPSIYVYSDGFNNLNTQRTGGLASLSTAKTRYYPYNDPKSDERYIQDGSAVITELDLSDFYSFIDTMQNVTINSAELTLAVKTPPDGMDPPASLYPMLMKKTSSTTLNTLNMPIDADSLKWYPYRGNIFTDLNNFVISSELSNQSPLVLNYDKSNSRYIGYATMFFQALFNLKDKPEYRIEHIGLYPALAPLTAFILNGASSVPVLKTGTGNSVNRAVLKSSGIKLKLYYTIPNLPNLE